jgi:hypothetical protein
MKLARMLVVCAVAAVPAAMAQRWEFGGGAGGGFYTSQDVSAPSGSAAAKIQSNVAAGVWLANNGRGRWGGEARYDYQRGALQLSSGGTQAAFGAETHALHYDILWHAAPSGARVRPFVAAGAGVKVYRGTGAEVVFQPLSNFALLTKARDLTALVSVGGGVKMQLTSHLQLRMDLHDYLTSFPMQVIAPNVGSKVGGWLHDFVPMVGLSYTSTPGE